MSKQSWCVEVAPLTSIPLSRSPFFTYSSNIQIPIGSLVSIPLFTRFLRGIVFDVYPESEKKPELKNVRLKPIHSVLQTNFLTQEQLILAKYLSQTCLTPLGRCLVHFTPHITLSKNKSIEKTQTSQTAEKKRITLTKEQKDAIENIIISKKPVYLFGPASSGKTEVYMRSIKKIIRGGGQALVLVPELTLIPQDEIRYKEFFGEDAVVVVHSHITPRTYSETWRRIAAGEAKIILGTRQALFAPFKNLKIIVIDEEQDDAYKQWDMSPRYDGREIAQELAQTHQASLVFGSATPSIERFHKTHTGNYNLATLPQLPFQPRYAIELVNLCFERYQKNFSPISKVLLSEIAFALKYNRQILLFINRQGSSAFTVCEECKTVLRCPQCERALVYDTKDSAHRCLHCTHTSDAFAACASCHSTRFKHVGMGTQKVEREIHKHFPGARIARIDRQTMQKAKSQKTVYEQCVNGSIDIIIGTQMATKGWDLPNVALVGIIDADSLFAFPDFKTDERSFQHLVQAIGRMARIGSKFEGKAFIQTFHPENDTIQKVHQKDYLGFYQKIIQEREDLRYPPFSQYIKIVLQEKDGKKIEKETQKTYEKLLTLTENMSGYRITPPHAPIIPKIRDKYRKQILIRCPLDAISPEIKHFLTTLSRDWIIDIHPVNLT